MPGLFDSLDDVQEWAEKVTVAIWNLENQVEGLYAELDRDVDPDEPVPFDIQPMRVYSEISEIMKQTLKLSGLLILNCELGVWERDEMLEGIETIQQQTRQMMTLLRSIQGPEL